MNADDIFDRIWADFILRLQALRDKRPKITYEKIGKMCGVSKVTVKRWLEGTGGEKTPFPDMLRYMQAVGMDISGVFSVNDDSNAKQTNPAEMDLDRIIADKDKIIYQLTVDKMSLVSEISSLKGEINALDRHLKRLTSTSTSVEDKDDKRTG